MSFTEFRNTAKGIYRRIEAGQEEVRAKGVFALRKFMNTHGILIAFVPHEDVAGVVGEHADKAPSVVSAVSYGVVGVHATSQNVDYKRIVPGGNGVAVEENVMNTIVGVVDSMEGAGKPSTKYGGFLITRDSGLVEGMPTRDFYDIAMRLKEALQKNGVKMKQDMPWAAGHTGWRNTKRERDVDGLFELVRDAPKIPNAPLQSIQVVDYQLTKEVYTHTVVHEVTL